MLIAFLLLCTFVLFCISWLSLLKQKEEIGWLREELQRLRNMIIKQESRMERTEPPPIPQAVAHPEPVQSLPPPLPQRVPPSLESKADYPRIEIPPIPQNQDIPDEESTGTIKQQGDWFARIIIWVGGVALLMAGFFMIKYSIESGILTPQVRLALTAFFGGILCAGGMAVSFRSSIPGNRRIGQSMAGAGIACLFFTVYAAVHLYGFTEPQMGFLLMVAVTALAIMLSLKQGAPIALIGLLGGFLTPVLMRTGEVNTPLLYLYLFLLFCGAQFLCARRRWWGLLLLSLLAVYAWAVGVTLYHFVWVGSDPEGTLLFILGICLVNALAFLIWDPDEENPKSALWLHWIRFLSWGPGILLGMLVLCLSGFQTTDFMLFSALSLGALLLAILRQDEFFWAAWIGLGAVMLSTFLNSTEGYLSGYCWPGSLLLIYFAAAHWRGLVAPAARAWQILSLSAGFSIVPLLYLNRELFLETPLPFGAFWLVLFVGGAALLIAASEHILIREADKKGMVSTYQFLGTILLGLGLWTEVPETYWPHTAAALMGLSALYWKVRLFPNEKTVIGVWAFAWTFLMLPPAVHALGYFFSGSAHGWGSGPELTTVGSWVAGLVAALLTVILYHRSWEETTRKRFTLWFALIALAALVSAYQYWDLSHRPEGWSDATIAGGLTALLALAAVLARLLEPCFSVNRLASFILAGLVAFRIVFLHLDQPALEADRFFVNGLLLQFAFPLLSFAALACISAREKENTFTQTYQWAFMVTGFILGSYLVRDYFGGTSFFSKASSHSEIYSYSVVWLLLAIFYLTMGLWRNQKAMHMGSLTLLLLTVGKVFLFDASELEGLYRVLSFLGLGVTLLGIGYFYNRIVFANTASRTESE